MKTIHWLSADIVRHLVSPSDPYRLIFILFASLKPPHIFADNSLVFTFRYFLHNGIDKKYCPGLPFGDMYLLYLMIYEMMEYTAVNSHQFGLYSWPENFDLPFDSIPRHANIYLASQWQLGSALSRSTGVLATWNSIGSVLKYGYFHHHTLQIDRHRHSFSIWYFIGSPSSINSSSYL